MTLSAPFPWFGGKSRVAHQVWARFGDTPNYVEPFAGSLAVLLGRPKHHAAKIETVNDLDGFVSNFWRAVAANPSGVARAADWPVIEADLNARHAYLVGARDTLLRRMEGDPDYYDVRIAGWWVAGVCGWIGGGFVSGNGPWVIREGELVNRRTLPAEVPGEGITRGMPHLGDGGRGINRSMPHLGDTGQGINRQMPPLSVPGQGIYASNAADGIDAWFTALANRLRRVRVTNGSWERVLSEAVTFRHGLTAVFLDPPYGEEVEQTRVYASDSGTVSGDVRAWCLEAGHNPLLRIALCGYAGEGHEVLEEAGWVPHAYSSPGGYGGGRGGTGESNRHRERVWYSPACLDPDAPALFTFPSSGP